ncbi:hypothetical protein RF11_05016 [Thelohanellus kitauei]|uniref:Uncharacterized protein n=1 Tax=Thelohanellus kitauei TaxID=669202 RepID=A0A0C2MJQ5_THEKT|nr:hypothetical protein RF11_05016 [Thelohanellus kitauei]
MSPNIIQIRHIEGLDRPFLDNVFDGIRFHKISPPLTPKGVWKLYVAKRDDYLLLLTQPYLYGGTFFDQSSMRLPMYPIYFKSEQKISASQICLFSRSDKLTNSEQIVEAIPELSYVYITKCPYENRNLFIFHIRDRSKYLQVLHLNGSSLSKTTIYNRRNHRLYNDIWRRYYVLFSFHSVNNISSNILFNSYNKNLPPLGNENETDQDEIGSFRSLMFNPNNLETFKQKTTPIMLPPACTASEANRVAADRPKGMKGSYVGLRRPKLTGRVLSYPHLRRPEFANPPG